MENVATISTATQRYAAAALFALALHQSQIHQSCLTNSLGSLDDEPIGQGISVGTTISISDQPKLWVHEKSGLLSHVFRFLELDDKAVQGLKETAGSSSQVRHHVGAFLALLSEESDGKETFRERADKELGLEKTVDAVLLNIESCSFSSKDATVSPEHQTKCHENKFKTEMALQHSGVAEEPSEGTQISSTPSHNHQTEGHENNFNIQTVALSDVDAEPCKGTDTKGPRSPAEEITCNESGQKNETAMKEESLLSYQRKLAVLYELLLACLADIAEDDNNGSKLVKGYDARHRVALRLLATWFGIDWSKVEALEIIAASSLIDSRENKEETKASGDPWYNWKRGGIIGAAALTGGTVMAITGGVAAPAIAHGMTALAPTMGSIVPAIGASGFTAAASATGSAVGSVAVAASFGAAGAGLAGYNMAKRVGGINEFVFKEIGETHNQGRLAVGIFISGIVFEGADFITPWEGQNNKLERYALRWETDDLIALSTAVRDWVTSNVALELMSNGAMLTVLSALLSALAIPAMLVSAINYIDGKWAIAVDRSDKAGKLLADILLQKLQGNRPVTLVGFSLGARIIFKCLWHLAQREGDNAGLVERVVLLGAPLSLKDEQWDVARKMVAGRFVNAYCSNDWTLGIIYRASLLSQGLAGIQPVDLPGIENVDVTELIEGHSSYLCKTKDILERLDLECYYPVFRTEGAQSS